MKPLRMISIERGYALLGAALLLYGVLAVALALAKRPGCDEAWFAGPAYNLAFHGYMGTPALEPATAFEGGRNFKGLDRFTYWIMPLSPVLQAGWYRLVGFSLIAMRSLSILWGAVALLAWFRLMRASEIDTRVASLALALISADYVFLRSAAHGRMDMMCVALNFSAFSAYATLRRRSLTRAVLVSHGLAALSILTHPNGFLALAGLFILSIIFDRRLLRWRHLALAAAPYLVGLAGWGVYIAQAPDLFMIQFKGNAAGRLWSLHAPLRALGAELRERYLGGSGVHNLKWLLLAPYATGVAVALTAPAIRRNRFWRFVLWLAAFQFTYFWLFEGTKLYLYVVHVSPLLLTLLAAWMGRAPRWLQVAGLAAWFCVGIGGVAYIARRNDYGNAYWPAIHYLRERARPEQVIMGSAELGFALGFTDRLIDDTRLGYTSGKQPDLVVTEERYEGAFGYFRAREPDTYRHIRKLLDVDLRLVYQQGVYRIYARPATSPEIASAPHWTGRAHPHDRWRAAGRLLER